MRLCAGFQRLAALLLALAAAIPAAAQVSPERDVLFRQLLEDPTNIDLMLRYARLSVAERDYEAAIGTLERLVDIDPEAQEARFELALAYFALGANEVALFHLEIYRTRGDLTPAEEAAVGDYIDSARERTQTVRFSGRADAGVLSVSDTDGLGLSAGLTLNAAIALDGPNARSWDTRLRLSGTWFPEDSDENRSALTLRTGPVLAVGGTAFGAELQPFVQVRAVDDNDDDDAGTSVSFGAEFSNTLDTGVTLDAALEHGHVARRGDGVDSDFTLARLGASFRPGPDTVLGASLRYFDEDYDPGEVDSDRIGVRMTVRHSLADEFLGLSDWSVRALIRYDREDFADGREDDLVGLGVTVGTYLRSDFFVNASARVFDRSSSDPDLDERDTIFAIGAGMEF